MKRTGIILIALLLMCHTSISQIINIPIDRPTIQAGIDSASAGDTILVAEGTYLENINFRGKAITLASQFLLDGDTSHISKTIIDGSEPVHPDSGSTVTMLMARDTTSVLCGFTIQGGTGTGPLPGIYGWTARSGGGIIMAGGKIINNRVRNNHVNYDEISSGGGIRAGYIQVINPDTEVNLVIRNNIVFQNSVHSDLTYCGGGGVDTDLNNGYTLVENNEILENTTATEAAYKAMSGGLHLGRLSTSNGISIIRNNYIHHNEAHSEFSFGGGLFYYLLHVEGWASNFHPTVIYNNVFSNNHSDSHAGGTCIWYTSISNSSPPTDPVLYNNSCFNNYAEEGSGLGNFDAKIGLFNNIFWDDLPDEGGSEYFDGEFTYCPPSPAWCQENQAQFQGNNNNIKGGWEGEGNISNDPMFSDDSFDLSEGSPCIGQGVDSVEINGVWYMAPNQDIYGNARPNPIDNRVDLGAIESPYEGYVYIPDPAFLHALIDEGVDTNGDSLISYAEAEAVTSLDVSGEGIWDWDPDTFWIVEPIENLAGIEAFVNLDTLNCNINYVQSLDVSNNLALRYLSCSGKDVGSELTSLNVSNNTALTYLDCGENQLTSLDVSNNTALTHLVCRDNQLTSLDVSNNTALTHLTCSYNQLKGLDVSSNAALTYLYCGYNYELTSLDLSNSTALTYLTCRVNQLTSLDVSNCNALTYLDCGANQLTSLDISNNTSLTYCDLGAMETLYLVCVWESFPTGVEVDTTISPNVYFTTECSESTGLIEYGHKMFSIYPNPTNDLLNVETSQPGQRFIEITSLNGQLIISKEMEGPTHQIDLSSFHKGVFFITIRSKDYVITRKIVKL